MKTLTRVLFACPVFYSYPSVNSFAQTVTISGKISNGENKEAVPAASILVKGGTAGTFTDNHGNFKLIVNHSFPFTLIISSIGYETKEVVVESASICHLKLI